MLLGYSVIIANNLLTFVDVGPTHQLIGGHVEDEYLWRADDTEGD